MSCGNSLTCYSPSLDTLSCNNGRLANSLTYN